MQKKYSILDDDIFAIVTHYQTRTPENAILESHRKYIDVQTVISGKEKLHWSSKDKLTVDVPYDEEKDAEFYKHNITESARIDLYPGIFVMLFPQDAHMPSLNINSQPGYVKKAVIKLNIALIG